eukprot:SAG31_NODE_42_length_31262_cov_46.416231_27_plen_72_part_00
MDTINNYCLFRLGGTQEGVPPAVRFAAASETVAAASWSFAALRDLCEWQRGREREHTTRKMRRNEKKMRRK